MPDSVQNQKGIAHRFSTESFPGSEQVKFFIGCSPSMASTIINPEHSPAGVMVSVNQLRKRKSDFEVGTWIMDSGAFTEISRYGHYRFSTEEYIAQINRWKICGNLVAAVAQDWMCESFVLERTGLDIATHQRLTIERFDELAIGYNADDIHLIPVLQGYQSYDYLQHLQDYGDRLIDGHWVGVGSVCRRNGKPDEILNILKTIKLIRPDLKLHGFGLKAIALEQPQIRELLYSCDSMAWSFPTKFTSVSDNVQYQQLAPDYQKKIESRISGNYQKKAPPTSGAGNGQGRKPKWKSPTKAIRVPEKYHDKVIDFCRQLEDQEHKPEWQGIPFNFKL